MKKSCPKIWQVQRNFVVLQYQKQRDMKTIIIKVEDLHTADTLRMLANEIENTDIISDARYEMTGNVTVTDKNFTATICDEISPDILAEMYCEMTDAGKDTFLSLTENY